MTQHSKFSEAANAADLYESNKAIMKLVSDGFLLKREDHTQKDLYIQLIDDSELEAELSCPEFPDIRSGAQTPPLPKFPKLSNLQPSY